MAVDINVIIIMSIFLAILFIILKFMKLDQKKNMVKKSVFHLKDDTTDRLNSFKEMLKLISHKIDLELYSNSSSDELSFFYVLPISPSYSENTKAIGDYLSKYNAKKKVRTYTSALAGKTFVSNSKWSAIIGNHKKDKEGNYIVPEDDDLDYIIAPDMSFKARVGDKRKTTETRWFIDDLDIDKIIGIISDLSSSAYYNSEAFSPEFFIKIKGLRFEFLGDFLEGIFFEEGKDFTEILAKYGFDSFVKKSKEESSYERSTVVGGIIESHDGKLKGEFFP